MILFFRTPSKSVIATEIDHEPSQDEINELCWLYQVAQSASPAVCVSESSRLRNPVQLYP